MKFLITACSGETLQVGPLAERNKVIDFAITSTHKDIKHLGEYVFRTYLDIERIIPGFSDHIAKESENRVAVLTEENAFTFGTRDLLLQTLGDKVVYADDFPLDSHDFNTLLAKVRAKGAKGIYLNVMSEGTLSTLVNQARALKLDQKLYSYNMPEASSFRKVTGKNSDGLEFIGTPVVVNASEEFKEALNAFWKIHPEGPSYEFGLRTAFDAIKSITDGVEAVGPDPTKVKEFLKSYESDGALGKISYDENGDIANINYVLKRVMEDGTNKVVGQLAK